MLEIRRAQINPRKLQIKRCIRKRWYIIEGLTPEELRQKLETFYISLGNEPSVAHMNAKMQTLNHECPIKKGQYVPEEECIPCQYGHPGHCHYPHHCESPNITCRHSRRDALTHMEEMID